MKVYHRAHNDSTGAIIEKGLLTGSEGEGEGNMDSSIYKTDTFLNDRRPPHAIKNRLDRITNTYCYIASTDGVIDITTGEEKPINLFVHEEKYTFLELEVDPDLCFVADLDLFDAIMDHLEQLDIESAEQLAPVYWKKVTPLNQYQGEFRRPEVIVTYSIPPGHVKKVESP